MAARTPTVLRESVGSMTLHIATFTAVDNLDTWASAIQHIKGWWSNGTDTPTTQTSEGVDVSLSTTTFTFGTGEADRAVMLCVLSKT
jgi:hypothetical protein